MKAVNALATVKPMLVTPEMLLETNVPEDDYPAWSPDETYSVNQRAIYEHNIYVSNGDDNKGHLPTDTTKWRHWSATNRWRLLDESIGSQTAHPQKMHYRFKFGKAVNFLGMLNAANVTAMRVQVFHPSYGQIWDKSASLRRRLVSSGWWNFYFGERRPQTQSFFEGLPAIPGTEVQVDFEGGEAMAVGVLIAGVRREFTLGVKRGAQLGFVDYSKKTRTEAGNLEIVERPYSDTASFQMLLLSSEVDAFNAYTRECRAKAVLWIGSRRFESTTIYGLVKDFKIYLNYYDYTDSELILESLT